MNKSNSAAHTKTFSSFNFLLNSKKFIRVQEKKLRVRKDKTIEMPSFEPISLPKRSIDSNDRCLSEEASPKHTFKEFNSKAKKEKEVKEQTIYQRISKIRNSCSPASSYGLGAVSEKNNTFTRSKFTNINPKRSIPPEALHLNLENITSPKQKKQKHINVDSIAAFSKKETFENDENDDTPQNQKNKEKKQDESESEQNSAYLDSSWRQTRKEIKKTQKNISFKTQEEQEKKTHGEIIKILRQINHSDVFLFDGLADKNIRTVHAVQANRDMIKREMKTINEIISPNKRLLKDPINFNLIESKANRFNVKNKRITLQSFVTKSEWENEKSGFPILDGNEMRRSKNSSQLKSTKKEFYSKWYLPVDYWKIPKIEQKRHLLDTPLKYGKEIYNILFKW